VKASRKLVHALVAVGLFFGLVEVGAGLYERLTAASAATRPPPRPGGGEAIAKKIQDEAQARHVDIPMVEDDYLGWKLPPDRIEWQGKIPCRINTDGFRGPDITPKPEGTKRILTLGDSSVFGDSVAEKDVLSSVAAREVSEALGVPVEGVIGAVPGHDSAQSLRTLDKIGSRVAPDWVVVGNLWSDLYAGQGTPRVHEIKAQWVRGPLRHLATYRVLVDLLTPWLRSQQVSWVLSQKDIAAPGGTDARVDLKKYSDNLVSIGEKAKALGARPIYLVLPAPVDLDAAPLPETILQYREAMRLVAAKEGAPVVDGPVLFKEKGADLLYFADQVHPNAYGHKLLGEALAQVIEGME